MMQRNQNWEELGRNIQDIVDRAITSQDYQRLNQTIRQTVEQAMGKAGRPGPGGRRTPPPHRPPHPRQPRAPRRTVIYRDVYRAPAAAPEKDPCAHLYRSTGGAMAAGILKIVGGSLLAAFSLLLLLPMLVMELGAGPLVLPLALMAGGGALIGSGASGVRRIGRFKAYRKVLGESTHCTLEKLARAVGKSVKFVRRELRTMIEKGYFLQGHLDKEENTLITSDETYKHYQQSLLQYQQRRELEAVRQQKKQESGHTPEVQSVLDKGEAFLEQIRACNDAIPGKAVSDKISRMELIIQRIFQRADTNPEVIPDLKKMMDYYLPMTVKLLNAYADMDAQPVQGETILSSKREIEATLDTLNLAFEKLLDELFEDTALDVSSDISVLQTLLAQEGLTEDDLSKLKKENNL